MSKHSNVTSNHACQREPENSSQLAYVTTYMTSNQGIACPNPILCAAFQKIIDNVTKSSFLHRAKSNENCREIKIVSNIYYFRKYTIAGNGGQRKR